jgi:hypothetical protein
MILRAAIDFLFQYIIYSIMLISYSVVNFGAALNARSVCAFLMSQIDQLSVHRLRHCALAIVVRPILSLILSFSYNNSAHTIYLEMIYFGAAINFTFEKFDQISGFWREVRSL